MKKRNKRKKPVAIKKHWEDGIKDAETRNQFKMLRYVFDDAYVDKWRNKWLCDD